jgi:hypothetical protein
MNPLDTYLPHCFSGLMVSIMPSLVTLFSGAKTLGWDTQKLLGNDFENLGEVLALLKCKLLERKVFEMKGGHWCLSIHPYQLTRATTLPWNGTGLSP